MVMKMNKKKFIEMLQEKTGYSNDQCIIIDQILESHFIIGQKNKQKIINELTKNAFTEDEAENIYDIAKNIIISEIKNKMKHPFKSQTT